MNTTSRIEKTVSITMADKGKRFLAGFTDFLTGGITDFDKRGDSPFQRDMKDIKGGVMSKIDPMLNYFAGGTPISDAEFQAKMGSFAQNAMDLNKINGTQRIDTGETSQGTQELAQKVNENEKTGLMQKVAGFLQNRNPYGELMRDTSVIDPISGQRVNEDFLKLLNNRPDLRQRFNEKGTIFSEP